MQNAGYPEGRSAARNGSKNGGRHRPSTAPLVANRENCRDVARLLLLEEPQAAEDAFLGEPLESVLHVTRWCMANADHPDYSPEQMLRGWACKRGRGKWSADRPTRAEAIVTGDREPEDIDLDGGRENEKVARLILNYWTKNPLRFVELLDQVEAAITGKKNGNGNESPRSEAARG